MTFSRPDQNLERPMDAYVMTADLPESARQATRPIIAALRERFGDALWYPPEYSQHITLLDWLQPQEGLQYPRPAAELFEEIHGQFERAMEAAVQGQGPIDLYFQHIELYPAAIIVRATDDGSYDRVRSSFGEQVTLHPETKPIPKNIIHSTIARFREAIPLGDVQEVLDTQSIDMRCQMERFVLVHMTKNLMLERTVLREFPL